MGQTGPREIGANLAFGVNLALFILQCDVKTLKLSRYDLRLSPSSDYHRFSFLIKETFSNLLV